ncbi:DsbA family protein [Mycolicibacterium goodii]|uniref:DsbA family protein n=1 Tax=Mycolicibacterium goodii TaxID=134601 RepID=A0ABS6HWG4_MYCGD|nr:DsbA family protein [Mycolicibacterium goodii]MBU8840468.1 DsbA family protein [Mycolicibacterium goodii]
MAVNATPRSRRGPAAASTCLINVTPSLARLLPGYILRSGYVGSEHRASRKRRHHTATLGGYVLKTPIGRLAITALAVTVIVTVAVFLLVTWDSDTSTVVDEGVPSDTASAAVVRDNSHRLNTAPDAPVTVVEFLDFECEGCRAAYPMVEELRQRYGDRVEFVLRYFPLPGHFNGERAARAVEAAAQQGSLEPMYRKMFDTQEQWGEQRTPADEVFRGFAEELGLDMAVFDTAYADPATADRVRLDIDDGEALGVMGTPTFFVNGMQIPLQTRSDLSDAIDNALQNTAPTS